jgi:hypothetical protein
MRGAIHSLPHYVFMAWCLVKHRDNFTFTTVSTPALASTQSPILLDKVVAVLKHYTMKPYVGMEA